MLPSLTSLETSTSTFVMLITASYALFLLLLLFHHAARNNLRKYFKRMLFVEFLCVKCLQQTNNGAAQMNFFYMHSLFTLNYSIFFALAELDTNSYMHIAGLRIPTDVFLLGHSTCLNCSLVKRFLLDVDLQHPQHLNRQ